MLNKRRDERRENINGKGRNFIIGRTCYTRINRKVVKEYNLGTNDYIIGVGYTGMMDSDAVEYGLEGFDRDCIVEALIHPCKYSDSTVNQHCFEFEITKNLQLKDSIIRLGFDITNYKSLSV